MSDVKMVSEFVYSWGVSNSGFPKTVPDFMDWLETRIGFVPEHCKHATTVSFAFNPDHIDGPRIEMLISYSRPETGVEFSSPVDPKS